MKCPRCETIELEEQERGDDDSSLKVDVCTECSGIWLDSSELSQMDDNLFVDMEAIDYTGVEASQRDAVINCPRCEGHVELSKVSPPNFKNVVVDICPTCSGFWLDKGELDKMREVSDQLLIASLSDE